MPQNPQIAAYVTAQKQYNTEISGHIDGVAGDIATHLATIDRLQNTPPVLDPADQALLDQIQEEAKALRDRLKAADDLTPPTPPTV